MTILHAPKNTIRQIDKVWMVVSVDPVDKTEGVCAVQLGAQMMPLLAADEERLPFLIKQAALLRAAGQTVKLIELSSRTEVTFN